jgi:hypothetical protein
MEGGMSVDCCERCYLGVGFFTLLPHMVDLKVTTGVGVAAVHGLRNSRAGYS